MNDPAIKYFHLIPETKSLGNLRNIAVSYATGKYIAQWDDDDLSDPNRLLYQMSLIYSFKTEGCLLYRHQIWWISKKLLFISCKRLWESSFLCQKDVLISYPDKGKGEDTPVIYHIFQHYNNILIDLPMLYTYVVHGNNTFNESHFEKHLRYASYVYNDKLYIRKINYLKNVLKF